MPFDGSGTFVRVYNWQDDAANGIKIRADRMDTEMDGFATGLTDCVTRDGQSPATADLPMGGFHHTNVADATDPAHYSSAFQVQNDKFAYCAVGGTATAITIDSSLAPAALAAGQRVLFFAGADITGAVTLNRNSLGAKSLKLRGAALASGQIKSGDLCIAVYDGTQYNLATPDRSIKPIAEGGTGSGTGSGALTALGGVPSTRTITASTGLTGGGDLSANRSLSVSYGTAAGTAAQGNDSRITGAMQKSQNGADIANAATFRDNLSLGTAATKNITVSASAPSGGANGDLWFQT